MNIDTAEGNQSYPHDSRGNVSQTVERFVEATEDLAVELDAPESVVSEFVESGRELAGLVEETAQSVESNKEQIENNASDVEDNDDELANHREHVGKRTAELNQRVATVEEEIDELEAGEPCEGDSSTYNPKGVDDETTALERVCGLPEHIVEDNLTANQRRARSVARRVEEYGKTVPAGIAITSSRIKRVLTAQEGTTIHRQTVRRVADFLERFGDGEVRIEETRGGKTTVVFDEQLVDNVTSVVTDNPASSVTPATI